MDESVISTTIPWTGPGVSDSVGRGENDTVRKPKSHPDFYFSNVFSDQVYFISRSKIKKCDFTITTQLHPSPSYGINSFELRLINYLITNDKYRGIYKTKSHYIHKSL
jgi:hypothetical protein